jgi:hypothetical protein
MAYEHEASRLRNLARGRALIWFTRHGEVERKQDKIEKIDVSNMLKRCSVTLTEINKKSGEEEWRAEGTDSDGRAITAVVVADEGACEIKVVTAWAKKGGG